MNSISFVCCIEAGRLENEVIGLATTLRSKGGVMSSASLTAVRGRKGPRLRPRTVETLERLNVRIEDAHKLNPLPWFNYSNKIAAVKYLDEAGETPLLAWLDSDIFVNSAPSGLLLDEGEDFGCSLEYLPPAIHRGDDANVGYWTRVCEQSGVNLESIPWIYNRDAKAEMRLNFNSGVFVWRRGCGFAQEYASAFERLVRSRVAMRNGIAWLADQVVLPPILVSRSRRYRILEADVHNMAFPGHLSRGSKSPDFGSAQLIHYSKSVDLPFLPIFAARLKTEAPELAIVCDELFSGARGRRAFSARTLCRGVRQELFKRSVKPIR